MNIVIIIQARMTSSRLPGKIMKEVLGKPLLEYQIERLKQVKLADNIVIATTNKESDEPVVQLCQRLQVPCFRGSEENVLERFYQAAKNYQADVVVRITGDCPLIDHDTVDKVIQFYLDNLNNYDYVSNTLKRSYPRGMDAEIFSFKLLEESYNEVIEKKDMEHVTPFFYSQPDRYKLANVSYQEDYSYYRLTVDTTEDFILIKKVIEELYPENPLFSLKECLELLNRNPQWKTLNEHIEQKKV